MTTSTLDDKRTWSRPEYCTGRGVITGRYTPFETDDVFRQHFAKLREIGNNQSLWPVGAEAPSRFSLEAAAEILRKLKEFEFQPDTVVASAEGGVAISFLKGSKYSDLECLNTGEILGVISDSKDRPFVWQVEHSPSGMARSVGRILSFLES